MKEKGVASIVIVVVVAAAVAAVVGGYMVMSGGGGGGGVDNDNNVVDNDTNGVDEDGGGPTDNEVIPENIPSAHYLDVPHVPQEAGICYLGCTTTMIKYYEPNIGLDDIVTYTGSATAFKDYTGATTEIHDDDEEEEEEPVPPEDEDEGSGLRLPLRYAIVPPTTRNLGYTPHIAFAGQATGFVRGFKQEMDSEGLSSQGELVDRIKELIASDNPVIAWFDEDSWWEKYFVSITGGPEPLVFTGYDENYMYAHVATPDPVDENRAVPIDNLSDGWGGEMTPVILYVTEEGEKKTDAEILSDLKTFAENAPTNLRTCADGLENGSISLGGDDVGSLSFNLHQYRALRDNVSVFLREKGYEDVAAKYENSADKFSDADEAADEFFDTEETSTPTEVANILREIATIENQAYNLWD